MSENFGIGRAPVFKVLAIGGGNPLEVFTGAPLELRGLGAAVGGGVAPPLPPAVEVAGLPSESELLRGIDGVGSSGTYELEGRVGGAAKPPRPPLPRGSALRGAPRPPASGNPEEGV